MDAALAGAGIAAMDLAYAAPHLASGRLRALDTTVLFLRAITLSKKAGKNHVPKTIRRLEIWLLSQAQTDNLPNACVP
jgi:DNA-binding transcriptional LysR family regulator